MGRTLRFASLDVLPERMRRRIAVERRSAPTGPGAAVGQKALAPRKYRNTPTIVDGIRFPSKREARCYEQLKLRVVAGEVAYFLRQVPLYLPGGTRYVVDFQVFEANGCVHYIDAKGRATPVFLVKKREVEHLYPITIELA